MLSGEARGQNSGDKFENGSETCKSQTAPLTMRKQKGKEKRKKTPKKTMHADWCLLHTNYFISLYRTNEPIREDEGVTCFLPEQERKGLQGAVR